MNTENYRGLLLDGFQKEAIEALHAGESVLVAAPTGTGKTLVADWIVEEAMEQGKCVIYTAPIKALSNQKYRDYCALYGEENVGLVTGDLVIRRDAPCRVMTTEILRNILLCDEEIPDLMAVIVDEIHFLDDEDRGTTWEEMLIYLPHHVQIVGLSATLANLHEFADWLSNVRRMNVRVIEEYKRAVPLTYRVVLKQNGLVGIDYAKQLCARVKKKKNPEQQNRRKRGYQKGDTTHIDVFKQMKGKHWPYLYFTFSRAKTEILATDLKKWLRHSLLSEEEEMQMSWALGEFKMQEGSDVALPKGIEDILKMGVAFHHAGVHVMLKNLVEELYEKRLIKVLYCTGTFALGINMPAKATVFDSLERFNGSTMIALPTREFMQMAGRAGRRGLDKEGLVVMRMNADQYPEFYGQIKRYLTADYEPVNSRFSLSFNSVANLLQRNPPERIKELVELSFLSWKRVLDAEKERQKAEELEEALSSLQFDVNYKKGSKKKTQKEINRRFNRAKEMEGKTWQEFEIRVAFLKKYQYISENGEFYAGGTALMNFQIQEILMTELFLNGMFEGVSDELLFGILTGLVVELPRSVFVYQARAKTYKNLIRDIHSIYVSDIVRDAARITQQQLVWEPQMIPIGKAWAEGQSLAELKGLFASTTDVTGTLIGAFRRAKDLLSQLRGAWADVPERQAALTTLMKLVSRDEVEVVA